MVSPVLLCMPRSVERWCCTVNVAVGDGIDPCAVLMCDTQCLACDGIATHVAIGCG
jgi:hypothetical protein